MTGIGKVLRHRDGPRQSRLVFPPLIEHTGSHGGAGHAGLRPLDSSEVLGFLSHPFPLIQLPLRQLTLLVHAVLQQPLVELYRAIKDLPLGLEPRMRHDVLDRTPVLGIGNKHALEQITGDRRDVLGDVELGSHDIAIEEVDVVAIRIRWVVIEGEIAG